MTPRRLAGWTTAVVVAAGAGAGAVGVASAASNGSASPSTPAATQQGTQQAKPGTEQGKHGKRGLLRRTAHGTFTVHQKQGFVTMALQRGQVVKVSSTSITLKSRDGYTSTYAVNSQTHVRSKGQPEQLSSLKPGELAMVVATENGSSFVAKRIACVREAAPAGAPTTSPSSAT